MKKETKLPTWAELKEFVNSIPNEFLDETISAWHRQGEQGLSRIDFSFLEDHYTDTTGEGLFPLGNRRNYSKAEWEDAKDNIRLKKGCPVIEYELTSDKHL